MKKNILLLSLLSIITATSYTRDYVIYEDEPEYTVYQEPEYVVYDEPEIIVEPVRYIRSPFVRKTVVVRKPTRIIHHYEPSNPAASIFSGLVGFGLGTAFGSAIAD